MKGKNIFISGGAGFIGTALVARLADDNRITVFDKMIRPTLLASELAGHANLNIIEGDVLDEAALKAAMAGAQIVVHAAAIAGIDATSVNPATTLRVNMLGTASALESARLSGTVERFVDFSTSEVFGSMAYNVHEACQAVTGALGEARWTYAVSKLAGEHLTNAYYKQYRLPTVTVRPFNVYGPGQMGEGAIHVFIRQALEDRDISIFGDGAQIRAWCYVDDLIEGLMLALESPAAIGESFNIGNARAVTTIYGLAQTVCRILGSRSRIVFRPPLDQDIELRIPNLNKSEKLLGYRAGVDLEEGILRTARWYGEHMKDLPALAAMFNGERR